MDFYNPNMVSLTIPKGNYNFPRGEISPSGKISNLMKGGGWMGGSGGLGCVLVRGGVGLVGGWCASERLGGGWGGWWCG